MSAENNDLFVSYSYVGKQDNAIFEGFGNFIADCVRGGIANIYDVEALHREATENCIKTMGMETASTTILFWVHLTPHH